MGFPRQEYWSRLPFLTPGDLPDPEIEPMSLMSHALAGEFFTTSATWEAPGGGLDTYKMEREHHLFGDNCREQATSYACSGNSEERRAHTGPRLLQEADKGEGR